MFSENEPVVYQGMVGNISFIGKNYVVMEIPPSNGRNPAKILIYHQNYKDIVQQNEV